MIMSRDAESPRIGYNRQKYIKIFEIRRLMSNFPGNNHQNICRYGNKLPILQIINT